MTDTELTFEQINEEVAAMLQRLGPYIGGDTNTIQVKARLDALTDILIEKAIVLSEELEERYARHIHGYLTTITEQVESALRRQALQADVAEQAAKLTVVR